MNIVLHEGPGRGFLSTYITLLNAYRRFVGREHISYKNIHISPDNFNFYGSDALLWFDIENYSNGTSDDIHWNTDILNEIVVYPTLDQLNILSYNKFIPYNARVKKYLKKMLKTTPLKKCLGIHYRGTDHYPTIIKEYDMLQNISEQLSTGKYEQVFICSDQDYFMELMFNYIDVNFPNIAIESNDVSRSSSSHPIFYQDTNKSDLGDQVLLDAHMLSKCDYVLGKASNIISYARILNLKLDGLYLDSNKPFLIGN